MSPLVIPLGIVVLLLGASALVAVKLAIPGGSRLTRVSWWFLSGLLLLAFGFALTGALTIQPAPDPWDVLDTLPAFAQNLIKYSLFALAAAATFIGAITSVVAALTALIIALKRLVKAGRGEASTPIVATPAIRSRSASRAQKSKS